MAWLAQLDLRYTRSGDRVVARHTHTGPLRVLQSLYPEGDAVCHNVLVHPPGGLVGGDTLDLQVHGEAHTHGLITTPGATRFYRSDGTPALQRTRITLEAGARLEWLPLEALCYAGCEAENRLEMELAEGAELMGWDVCALGLPQAQQPFDRGRLTQHIALHDAWLERAVIDAADERLLHSPVGMAGLHCSATLFFASGSALDKARRELLLDTARACLQGHALAATAGATSPCPQVVVLRVLAPLVEPAMQLLRSVRLAWRQAGWAMEPNSPRIWAM